MKTTYWAMGDTVSAVNTYQKAIDIRPGYWQGYSNLGTFYLKNGHYKKANEQFQKIVKLLPNSERGYHYLAATYFYMEEIDAAIEMAERATAIYPSYRNLNNLAAFQFFAGNYEQAAVTYKEVLHYNQKDHRIWGGMATAYYFTERQDSARIFYQKAVDLAEGQKKINPRDQTILVTLAGYYARLGQRDLAYQYLKEVEEMDPSQLDTIFDIGDVYEQLGDRGKALEWMEKAIRNNYKMARFNNNPGLQNLMADARFQQIVNKQQSGE
jgi:tetratricopeptide (TPR) repeat protein